MLKQKERILSLLVVLLFGVAVVGMTLNLEYAESRIMPLFIDGILIFLVCVSFFLDMTRPGKRETDASSSGRPSEDYSRLPTCFAWLVGYAVGTGLVGFYVSSFVFVLAYIRINCGRWTEAVLCSALCTAALMVFPFLFDIDLYIGVLGERVFSN